jgi:dTDP-L-rhamnose 4-epimerase
MSKVLITGGAGFVGSHLVDALVERGHSVRIYDSLDPQVHGSSPRPRVTAGVELIVADVCDRSALRKAMEGVEVIFHFAAQVGVGQSMYEIIRYVSSNTLGAAVLLDILANERDRLSVRKMIVASSMSVYGEGVYRCSKCGVSFPPLRGSRQLEFHQWEVQCPAGHGALESLPTDEKKPLHPGSVYAISKRDHEELFLCVGRAYRVPTVALRLFNIYGPRQALNNPYTGVGAIFCGQLLAGELPIIFEDGNQLRDLVHVSDVIQASLLAMERSEADYEVLNVGSGSSISIRELADLLIERLAPGSKAEILGRYRQGDVRHCYADITKAKRLLGYSPKVPLERGIGDLIEWVSQQVPDQRQATRIARMKEELDSRALLQ